MYRIYIRNKGKRVVICVDLKKALYGTLQAALLFWDNLKISLEEWGFEVNPYNWCVEKKQLIGNNLPWYGIWTTWRYHMWTQIWQLLFSANWLSGMANGPSWISKEEKCTTTSGWNWTTRQNRRLKLIWPNIWRRSWLTYLISTRER